MSDSADPGNATDAGDGPDLSEPDEDGPMQVDNPNYHHDDHTAVQTCGWTKNAIRGEGRCASPIV